MDWKCLCLIPFLLQCVSSARILGWFLFPSYSHQIVYQPIWKELSLRGHEVTVITPNPINDPTLVNLTEIDVNYSYELLKIYRVDQMMSKDLNLFQLVVNLHKLSNLILDDQLRNEQVIKLLENKEQTFDLIMIECFEPILWGLSARFKAPIIGVSSLGTTIVGHDAVGNPTHPILSPDILTHFEKSELTLTEKFTSIIHNLWYRFYYYNIYLPQADIKAKKIFGDIPYIGDIERNVSLMFLNVNRFLHQIRPNVPAIIELGLMHIKPVNPLPIELNNFLDDAKEGVVYFSLGTNMKSVNMPVKLRENIINALAELPYKVLWKWESDHLPGRPKNVLTRKWLPQQDILAHPNVKVFVTQGGLQSSEEAISRGVPLVGIPFLGDQTTNVAKLVELGVAVSLDFNKLTKDDLKNAILQVAQNRSYRENILRLKELLWDQPMTGLEKAVWWSEHVIRHKGASHLRSPILKSSWNDIYMIDVIIVTLLIIIIISVVLYQLCKCVSVKFLQSNKVKKN